MSMESYEQFTLWLALSTGGLALFVAAGTGFICGIWLGPWWQRRQFSRALKEASIWQNQLLKELESVEQNCARALDESQKPFPADRQNRLEKVQSRLIESMQRLANLRGEGLPVSETFQMVWITSEETSSTGLPSRTMFDQNLRKLLENSQAAKVNSALLLVRMDRFESILRRYGHTATNYLFHKMVGLIIRGANNSDLICQLDDQTISVLLPNRPPAVAWKQAEAIRDAIRAHHFLLEGSQQEVMITASSGLSCTLADDQPEDIMQRALRALVKAESQGRNRLLAE